MDDGDEAAGHLRGSGGLHGRRKGKALRSGHADLVKTLLPRLRLDLDGPLEPASLFPTTRSALRLEIGFGGGEHLIAQALANPEIGYIGCEPFLNGMAKALAAISERHLRNIRLHGGDATDVIAALPAGSLDGVDLFYPDPWPKRRQRKRRFLSDERLADLARVLKPRAAVRFATDIDDNAGWTLARVLRSPDFRWEARTAADWQQPWSGWVSTRYEAKALAAGRRPAYFTFIRC